MTTTSCMTFCQGESYSYAGLTYAQECFVRFSDSLLIGNQLMFPRFYSVRTPCPAVQVLRTGMNARW